MPTTSVLLDATCLGGAGGDRGVGTYVRQLLRELGERDDVRVAALCRRGVPLPPGVRPAAVARARPGRFQFFEHDLRLPRDIARHESDVFHGASLVPPRSCRRPWVETLFDAIPLTHPEPATENERRRWKGIAERMQRADAVIAVSRYAADVGMSVLGLEPARVFLAPLAAAPEFIPPAERTLAGRDSLLFVGDATARKGAAEAIAVLEHLDTQHRLRMCGAMTAADMQELRSRAGASAAADRIDVVGRVDDLLAEHHRAAVAIVSSRAEGFGLPALEAMASGTPIVAFANTATAEVVAGGGVLVADGDVAAMASCVRTLATDERAWLDASDRALHRAAEFDWRACADVHVDVYRGVAERGR